MTREMEYLAYDSMLCLRVLPLSDRRIETIEIHGTTHEMTEKDGNDWAFIGHSMGVARIGSKQI